MPVEIRELIIKTEIRSIEQSKKPIVSSGLIDDIKNEVLENCKRMISESAKKKVYNR
ncbi:hypothetical protein SAMN04489761_0247 [Tenacibaculum sp. MAR_2009_124]|uniref:DUF5908 family protein n=1 Tax=Tenacibaculum sp. MAR_2009_124 TaxID=1250059 RepID=UPI000894D9E8|nr:DUF5908 family protein [Tenacibaculum sp. MAR_2009_124]SEB37369.1 hypothetical protein SAMN04489761_0247 [Tenacibaculum sp. MAR_2009_124]